MVTTPFRNVLRMLTCRQGCPQPRGEASRTRQAPPAYATSLLLQTWLSVTRGTGARKAGTIVPWLPVKLLLSDDGRTAYVSSPQDDKNSLRCNQCVAFETVPLRALYAPHSRFAVRVVRCIRHDLATSSHSSPMTHQAALAEAQVWHWRAGLGGCCHTLPLT